MIIAGIISEYNPFHAGHKYHIEKTRSETNCDYVVACMSGAFTQRGEMATACAWRFRAGATLCLNCPRNARSARRNGLPEAA